MKYSAFFPTAAAAAISAAMFAGAASAAPILVSDNVYTGTLAGSNDLGTLDLADGAFVFSGITGASSGSLTVDFISTTGQQGAVGAMQILIQALSPNGIMFDSLSFDGMDIALVPVIGGYAARFSGMLPATLDIAFSNANAADSFQVTVAAVPVPAAGLLLIGALGGLALLRRKATVA